MPTSLDAYSDYARQQFTREAPGPTTRAHANGWRGLLKAVARGGAPEGAPLGGVFEVTSLVIARWEFLGGLYLGTTDRDTSARDAAAYARKFLSQYDHTHHMSGGPVAAADASDIFTMLRNKPLHGFTPAGVLTHDRRAVVTWGLGETPYHLQLGADGLHVDCNRLADDLCDSMNAFADYLDEDADVLPHDHRRPQARWLRAAWSRFRPAGFGRAEWMDRGVNHYGVPG